MEAIILAGGLGTRLGALTKDTPKPLLPVAGRPFLEYLLAALDGAGCARGVLSIGHLGHLISAEFGEQYRKMRLCYAVEDAPLGTGGGMRNALRQCEARDVLLLNGDTWTEVDYGDMLNRHQAAGRPVTVCVRKVDDTGRYGRVQCEQGAITGFVEKGAAGPGWINTGVYAINRNAVQACNLPERFSFEKDFLERFVDQLRPAAYETSGKFIDIGVPEDYRLAQTLLLDQGFLATIGNDQSTDQ